RLEQFIKLNGIKGENKCAVLLTYLTDETYRLAHNLIHPTKIECVSYESLVKALNEHFAPVKSTFAEKSRFYGAVQEVSESVEEWAARLRGLVIHGGFGDSLDMVLRDRFVLGLRIGPERDRLFELKADDLTFSRAVEVAKQTASAREARNSTAMGAAASVMKEEPKCRYKNYTCQKCGRKGHLKKVCSERGYPVHNMSVQDNPVKDIPSCKECELFNMRCSTSGAGGM
ncbi:unnamed protein product, partial [Leptidea sinapis]